MTIPCTTACIALGGAGTISAYARAATSANRKLKPKTRAGWPSPALRVSPAARCHARPKSTGEYQRPPTRKLDSAATTTARMLMFAMELLLLKLTATAEYEVDQPTIATRSHRRIRLNTGAATAGHSQRA